MIFNFAIYIPVFPLKTRAETIVCQRPYIFVSMLSPPIFSLTLYLDFFCIELFRTTHFQSLSLAFLAKKGPFRPSEMTIYSCYTKGIHTKNTYCAFICGASWDEILKSQIYLKLHWSSYVILQKNQAFLLEWIMYIRSQIIYMVLIFFVYYFFLYRIWIHR